MRAIKQSTLRDWCKEYPDADEPLEAFLAVVKAAEWRNLQDVRKTYRHADAVIVDSGKTVTVLNIGGNKYRLVVAIHYNRGLVYLLRFMTHAEYNKEKWKRTL